MKKRIYIAWFCLTSVVCILSLIYSCASTGRPSGGPRDKTPPQLDTSKSTPNYSTFFDQQKIELYFDEFITANRLITKTIISPPLVYIPKLEARGKKLTIEFNEQEELKENATYLFNFGDAIKDFREGNKIENFLFVFSTGAVIDSLSLSGKVTDALTGDPISDVYIMLFDETRDSVIYEEKPFYFVISDKDGNYKFSNLRSDTFKIFALKDANLNYIYDQESEMIGYRQELIHLTDTFIQNIDFRMFLESTEVRFLKKGEVRNKTIDLIYVKSLESTPTFRLSNGVQSIFTEIIKDTLRIWHDARVDSFEVFLPGDTLTIKPQIDSSIYKSNISLAGGGRKNRTSTKILAPKDSLSLEFTSLIKSIRDSLINMEDSTGNQVSLDWIIYNKEIKSLGAWKTDSLYTMTMLPGAVQDIYDRTHDTLVMQLKINPVEKYGDIFFTLEGLDTNYQYIVTLRKGNNKIAYRTVNGIDSIEVAFNTIPPDQFEIDILEDKNANGKWDPGSYQAKTYPEKSKTVKLEKLRENWELKASVDWQKEE